MEKKETCWGEPLDYWQDRADSDGEFLDAVSPILKRIIEERCKEMVELGILEEEPDAQ